MIYNIELLILILVLIWFLQFILKPYLERKNDLRDKEIKNKRDELYMAMDAELVEKEIDSMVEKEMNQYVLINFISQNILYIRQPEIEKMIIILTNEISNKISGLYIFYIRVLVSVENEEELKSYIKQKVQEHVLKFTIDYNKTGD